MVVDVLLPGVLGHSFNFTSDMHITAERHEVVVVDQTLLK